MKNRFVQLFQKLTQTHSEVYAREETIKLMANEKVILHRPSHSMLKALHMTYDTWVKTNRKLGIKVQPGSYRFIKGKPGEGKAGDWMASNPLQVAEETTNLMRDIIISNQKNKRKAVVKARKYCNEHKITKETNLTFLSQEDIQAYALAYNPLFNTLYQQVQKVNELYEGRILTGQLELKAHYNEDRKVITGRVYNSYCSLHTMKKHPKSVYETSREAMNKENNLIREVDIRNSVPRIVAASNGKMKYSDSCDIYMRICEEMKNKGYENMTRDIVKLFSMIFCFDYDHFNHTAWYSKIRTRETHAYYLECAYADELIEFDEIFNYAYNQLFLDDMKASYEEVIGINHIGTDVFLIEGLIVATALEESMASGIINNGKIAVCYDAVYFEDNETASLFEDLLYKIGNQIINRYALKYKIQIVNNETSEVLKEYNHKWINHDYKHLDRVVNKIIINRYNHKLIHNYSFIYLTERYKTESQEAHRAHIKSLASAALY